MQDFSLLRLAFSADLTVQVVLLVLLALSFISWWIIIYKYFLFLLTKNSFRRFNNQVDWEDPQNLASLFSLYRKNRNKSMAAQVFTTSYQAVQNNPEDRHRAEHSVYLASFPYWKRLNRFLAFLATVGSVAPYLGLLGTVLGIMHSFASFSQLNQIDLNTIAPGIAQALVSTAFGLFVAIPAYVFYNSFAASVSSLQLEADNLSERVLNLQVKHES